jgi:hypothetical protein
LDTKQIDLVKNFIYLFSFISLIIQLIIFKNNDDLFCILIIFLSNILTTYYCFNKKYFFEYPITLLMIFISHFINLGGALFFKSLEFSLITKNLELPLSTILLLSIFNFTIILSHTFYRSFNFSIKENLIKKYLKKYNFYTVTDIKFLYLLSIIAIISNLFFFDLNTRLSMQGSFGYDAGILKDITNGFAYFVFMPIVILFYKSLYDVNTIHKTKIFFIISFLFIIFISLSRNNRSILFDTFLLAIFVLFILILFNKIDFKRNLFIKIILIPAIVIPSFNFIENLSNRFLNERLTYIDRTPLENVKMFLGNALKKNDNTLYLEKKYLGNQVFFAENYYSTTLFNRANLLLIHDNFNYINKNISDNKLGNLKNIQVGKIISILPQPIINIFNNNFDKNKFIHFTTASYLYGYVDYGGGSLSTGSALMTLYIVVGQWIYIFLFLFFIPVFIFFDSFYDRKTVVISPYIIIFFYITSGGILNFISASDINIWLTFIFRTIPQTFIFIIILRFIYNFFLKKNNF